MANRGLRVAGVMLALAGIAAGAAGCCFGGTTTTSPPTTGTGPTTGTAPPPVGGPGQQFNIGPGFMPDPQTASGSAGGPVAASTMSPDCRGYIASAPNHILNATGQFTNLRILAASPNSQDLTLVVQRADGSFVCNDDSLGGGLQPEVSGMFGPGQHRIWIGTYSSVAGPQPYTLGLTEMPTVTHASLGGGGGAGLGALGALAGGLIPQECGQNPNVPANYGPITVGSMVTLGAHTGYTGLGADGQMVTNDINWAPEMQHFVGQRTTITELSGVDDAGCPVVKVAVDSGQYYWRIRNMTL